MHRVFLLHTAYALVNITVLSTPGPCDDPIRPAFTVTSRNPHDLPLLPMCRHAHQKGDAYTKCASVATLHQAMWMNAQANRDLVMRRLTISHTSYSVAIVVEGYHAAASIPIQLIPLSHEASGVCLANRALIRVQLSCPQCSLCDAQRGVALNSAHARAHRLLGGVLHLKRQHRAARRALATCTLLGTDPHIQTQLDRDWLDSHPASGSEPVPVDVDSCVDSHQRAIKRNE